MTPLRLGTRGSALALAQSGAYATRLATHMKRPVELVPITTHGDTSRAALNEIGGEGVFVTALRDALLEDRCDLVVHSLKDLPTAPQPGLTLACIPERADVRDALCARDGFTLATLPAGARVGTGSPRRVAQLREAREDLVAVPVRGNVDTRLGLVTSGQLDAVILAAAGLDRLGRLDAATELCDPNEWPTAAGQGALAIEIRTGCADTELPAALIGLHHPKSAATALAERHVLAELQAGCSAPVGVHAYLADELCFLTARVYGGGRGGTVTSSRVAPTPRGSHPDLIDIARDVAQCVVTDLLGDGAGSVY